MKKYKLNIPDSIRKEDAWLVEAIEDEGEIFTGYEMPEPEGYKAVRGKQKHAGWYEIPEDWLEEVIEKSAAEKWVEAMSPDHAACFLDAYRVRELLCEAFAAGSKNAWNAALDKLLSISAEHGMSYVTAAQIRRLKE